MHIILPSENQTREFDAKLLLALFLVLDGHNVIVGARHEIHNNIGQFPPGLYFAKDFRRPSERILRIIKGLGHRIVAWDEEGLVQPSADLYYSRRYTRKAIEHVDAVLAWGPRNADLTKSAPAFPDIPIQPSGNPRIDMLRPELREFHRFEVDDIRKRFGRFVLFDTNFASFNPAIKTAPVALGFGSGSSGDAYLRYRAALFERWKALIPKLAETIAPSHLIIRPHPSEAHQAWIESARHVRNVTVVHEGSATAWILASDVMVHSGCTTAIEATILSKPAIAFRPAGGLPLETDLPDQLSEQAETENALINLVCKSMAQKGPNLNANADILAKHLYALNGPLASKNIQDFVRQFGSHRARSGIVASFEARIRSIQKKFTRQIPGHKTSVDSNLTRYPGLNIEQVKNKVERFKFALPVLALNVNVEPRGAQTYMISADRSRR